MVTGGIWNQATAESTAWVVTQAYGVFAFASAFDSPWAMVVLTCIALNGIMVIQTAQQIIAFITATFNADVLSISRTVMTLFPGY